jgi:hypothetical protein
LHSPNLCPLELFSWEAAPSVAAPPARIRPAEHGLSQIGDRRADRMLDRYVDSFINPAELLGC